MNDIAFLPSPVHLPGANIKVVGVGGAGCNALNRMMESGVSGVQFIAMNTDQQSLAQCRAAVKISLGPGTMRGLGAGGDPVRGKSAAEESRDEILASLNGADMVFITAGMGGGTGTGAAPVVANCANEAQALAVAVVITPFQWEGSGKMQKANEGVGDLRSVADSVIVVSNEKLKDCCHQDIKTKDAYASADGVLIQGVKGITDLILRPGIINGDFADVRAVLCNSREALIGTGQGRGDDPLKEGVRKALECPLLERDQRGSATKVIVSVMADWDKIPLSAVEEAMKFLRDHYKGQPDIKLCQAEAPELEDRVLVTILASGFDVPFVEDILPARTTEHPEPLTNTAASTIRVHGDQPYTVEPTRVIGMGTQPPPTPSGEVEGMSGIEIPAIVRMQQGRLLE